MASFNIKVSIFLLKKKKKKKNVPNSGLWLELWREGALFLKRMGFRAVRKLDAMDKREAAQLFLLCSLYYVGVVVEFGEQNPLKSL